MAISVMSAVWATSALGGTELLLLLAIADFTNQDGIAYPSVATLAKKIRMGERNTQYLLKKLVMSGELEIERNAGPRGCNVFRVKALHSAGFAPVQSVAVGGATNRSNGVQSIAPEPSLNHQEPSNSAQQKKSRTKMSQDTLQAFLNRCEAVTVDPIPADDPVFQYGKDVGLTDEMIELCWFVFKDRHLANKKQQKDWRMHFRNAVKFNWYKLWFIGNDGTTSLTTSGRQAQREMKAAEVG